MRKAAALTAILLGLGLSAQALEISASVNKDQVALNDQVVLSVTVAGAQASLPDPQLPPMPNFSVYSSGRNQSISIVNGKLSASAVHTFVLVPRAVGKGVVPPISVSDGGGSKSTPPIELQVVPPGGGAPSATRAAPSSAPAAAANAAAPEVFITAELDKKRSFVNEQVTLTVRFHTAVSLLGNPEYNAPKLTGFLSEDLPPLRNRQGVLHGRQYYITEVKTALFPLQAGRLSVGAARVRCQVAVQGVSADPFAADFFDRFFSSGLTRAEVRDLASDPLTLEVEPLPAAGKPADFDGAVGEYSIAAETDRTSTKVGEAVSLTVTIRGTGNIKALGDLKLPDLPSWRVYDPVASVNEEKKDDRVRGSKVLRTVLVPRVSGELALPPLSLSYFHPAFRAYVRASTRPLKIAVAAGDPGSAPAVGFTAPTPVAPKGLTQLSADVRYLKTNVAGSPITRALEALAGAGPLNGAPFALFALSLAWAMHRERRSADPKGTRLRAALKTAAEKTSRAEKSPDAKQAAGLMAEALAGYLADKLGEPASGLTLRRAQELLRARGLPEASLERLRALWEDLDVRRFAPVAVDGGAGGRLPTDSGGGTSAPYGAVGRALLELLRGLEKELRR